MGIKALGNLLNLENRFTRALPNDSTGARGAEILGFSATGGNQNTSTGDAPGNGYKYHVFTSPGTLTIQGGSKDIEFLVVGGGGGGGFGNGGGAGAGGLRSNDPNIPGPSGMKVSTTVTLNPGSYAIGVGTGGNSDGTPFAHRLGESSSIGPLVIASGGGAGGPMPAPDQVNYQDAGSGGGQEAPDPPESSRSGVSIDSPDSLSPDKQGYNGGTANGGGGGGGAGGQGSSATGGPKLSCPAYSSPIIHPICPMPSAWQTYVGSGGAYAGGGYGYPGRDNGHNGPYDASPTPENAYAGVVNTGGGADSNQGGDSVQGGTGIVIIRYQPD
jgi:hypothetical protein